MKAPNKIYLNIPKQELEAPLDSTTWDTKEFDDCINVEYIKRDFLLKWLDERVLNSPKYEFGEGFNAAIGQVIGKIISL